MTRASTNRMPSWSLALAWVSVALILVGFVLPWARIDVREPSVLRRLEEAAPVADALGSLGRGVSRVAVTIQRGAETITGDLPTGASLPAQVSGAQIPRLAHQEQAKVAIALLEMLTGTRRHVGLKSYAVYMVPALALLCGIGLTLWRERPLIIGAIGGMCAVVAAVGWWKVLTTNTQTLFVTVTIERGVWCSLWGYAGLACAAGGLLWIKRGDS